MIVSGKGITTGQSVQANENNEKTKYVSDPSDFPAAVGGEILLSISGPYNTYRITGQIDISPNVIVLDDVAIDSNGSLGVSLVTAAPGKPLFRSLDNTAIKVSNVSLANYGVGGKIFECNPTNGINLGKSFEIRNFTILYADVVANLSNFFLYTIKNIAIFSFENGGFNIGSPSSPSGIVANISDVFQVNEATTGGNVFNFNTSIPFPISISMKTMDLLSKTGFYGVNITDIANVGGVQIIDSNFNGSGTAINGFTSESNNVLMRGCSGPGVINTPTNFWAKYTDLATKTTPIILPPTNDPGGPQTKLTNDTLSGIDSHLPSTITKLWDGVNNKVYLADIPVGTPIEVIVNFSVNVNQNFVTISFYGIGLDPAQTLFTSDTVSVLRKNAYVDVEKRIFITVDTADIQENGVELFLRIDDPPTIATGTVIVNHFVPKLG